MSNEKKVAIILILQLLVMNFPLHNSQSFLNQHGMPIVNEKCKELGLQVISAIPENFTDFRNDNAFQKIAGPVVKVFPEFDLTENRRFILELTKSDGDLDTRYGSCSIPFNRKYFICSFTLNFTVHINYMMHSRSRHACMEDTSPKIKVWDSVAEQFCILNFGANCCIYDPFIPPPPAGESVIPLIVSLLSLAALVIMLVVYLAIKGSMLWNRRKAGN